MIVSCIYCGVRRSEYSALMLSISEGFRCKGVTICQSRARVGTPRTRGVDLWKCR